MAVGDPGVNCFRGQSRTEPAGPRVSVQALCPLSLFSLVGLTQSYPFPALFSEFRLHVIS